MQNRKNSKGKTSLTGADPGFPVGRGANPLGGSPTYDFVKFSQKLHEIEKILGCGGRGGAPLDPPLVSLRNSMNAHKNHF